MSKTNNEVDKQERDFVEIDKEKFYIDEMDDNQKSMVIHLKDLTDKVSTNEYAMTQLQFARQAFVNALKESFLVEVIDD